MYQDSFGHERLTVYRKALVFVADAEGFVSTWDKRHAIVDHLSRASEGIIVNTAEGCRADTLPRKQTAIDYAIGSALECAACLDVAQAEALVAAGDVMHQKEVLSEITRMLMGLRASWESEGVGEEEAVYGARPSGDGDRRFFYHERLDAYQVALDFVKWLCANGKAERLPGKTFKKLDQTATSMILNIAEGNGRFSQLDRSRFLTLANAAAVKLSAYLDIYAQRRLLLPADLPAAKSLLVRVANMTAAMTRRP